MSVVTVSGLCVERGGQSILRNVSLSLGAGEIVRISGPSGSGKTTLLRAIAQLLPFAAGSIRLNGQTAAELGYPRWRARVVYAPQRPVLFEGSTHDNLCRAFQYRHVSVSFSEQRAAELLTRLDLGDLIEQRRDARELSGGEQQRVQLIRSLLLQPIVLLMDEPTASLGTEHVAAVEQLLAEYTDSGGAALLVTHDEAQAERISQRSVPLS